MKKRIAYILAIMMLLSCCACKGKTEKPVTNNSSQGNTSSDMAQSDATTNDTSSEIPNSSDQNIIGDNSSQIFVDDTTTQNDGFVSDSTMPDNSGSQSQMTDTNVSGDNSTQTDSSEQQSGETENSVSSDEQNDENISSNQESSESTSSKEEVKDNSSNEEASKPTSSKEETSEQTSKPTSSEEQNSSNNDSDNNSSTGSEVTVGNIQVTDSPIFENFITVDDTVSYPNTFVEYKTAPSTLDTPWNKDVSAKKGNSDAQADAIRQKVLNTKNTLDYYDVEGTVYYVSPNGDDSNDGKTPKTAFKSMKAPIFSMNILKPGDAVLFQRDGLWRLTSAIKCKKGVTYGSYGEGEKPTFYGSPYNYANKDYWYPSNRQNIWKVAVADSDIGLVVLNNGEMVGVKKLNGLIALEKNGDYYFNKNQDMLYLYYDGGNPGKVFDDIEIGLNKAVFSVSSASDVTIDNLRIKYSGRFGIDMYRCDNSIITNCEIGFIGGAIQSGSTRLGNGIQVWNGVVGHEVSNCWIYQIYDAAVTFQGDNSYAVFDGHDIYKNITYKNNLFEYATYSVEFWHAAVNQVSSAVIENFVCTDNVSRFAGYGWGRQRSDHTGNHICVFERAFPNAKGNKITNNIFDLADSFVVKWGFRAGADNGEWDISGNTYYHGPNKFNEAVRFGSMEYATNLNEFKNVLSKFETNPKAVHWIDEVS